MTQTRGDLWAERVDPARALGIHAPQRSGDCGWDLAAMETVTIPPMGSIDVPVNARIQLPPGMWGQILARSSINKRDLHVECGVIDHGYRGPLFVVLRNMRLPQLRLSPIFGGLGYGRDAGGVVIEEGERVGQLVLHKLHVGRLVEREIERGTERGEDGFGSTGTGLDHAPRSPRPGVRVLGP